MSRSSAIYRQSRTGSMGSVRVKCLLDPWADRLSEGLYDMGVKCDKVMSWDAFIMSSG